MKVSALVPGMMCLCVVAAAAETVTCPQMHIPLSPKYLNRYPAGELKRYTLQGTRHGTLTCAYGGDKNHMNMRWQESMSDKAWRRMCQERQWYRDEGPVRVHFSDDGKHISVDSTTHMAELDIFLSKKEYRKKWRKKWAEAGQAFLLANMELGMPCAGYDESVIPEMPRPDPVSPRKADVPAPVPEDVDDEISDILKRLKDQ